MQYLNYIIIAIAISFVIFLIYDFIRIIKIKIIPAVPQMEGKTLNPDGLVRVYEYFRDPDLIPEGIDFNEEYILSEIDDIIKYIDTRYDCADFWAQLLFRLYKDYGNKLSDKLKNLIKKTLLGFKYWIDMPEKESMCFFSENHTLLFAELEYLVGQEWPEEIFSNSGLKGEEHKKRGKERLFMWFDQKYRFGFFEWYSNNYFNEDIGPLAQLLDYSEDEDILRNAKNMLDLMWFEVATHSVENRFVAVSSRMYGDNKGSNKFGNRIQAGMNAVFNDDFSYNPIEHVRIVAIDCYMMICLLAMLKHKKYTLPKVIKDIAKDNREIVIKSSNGLDPEEYRELGLIGQSDYQIISQFSNETFVNKGFSTNTYRYHKRNNTFGSAFTDPIQWADLFLVRVLRIFPLLSLLGKHFIATGISLSRGNVYAYRNNGYLLSTAINCHKDYNGMQIHIWSANIKDDLNVFTQYPSSVTSYAGSPGYWVGNRRLPFSVQDKNINLTIFRMSKGKRLGEFKKIQMTHTLFPSEKFDDYSIEENFAFGRRENIFIALICNKKLSYKTYNKECTQALVQHVQTSLIDVLKNDEANNYILKKEYDLCAYGKGYHCYVTELSDASKETYEEFKNRIKENKFMAEKDTLKYCSQGKEYTISYKNEVFTINGEKQELQYKRFDSPYCEAERNPDNIDINYGEEKYNIQFEKKDFLKNL